MPRLYIGEYYKNIGYNPLITKSPYVHYQLMNDYNNDYNTSLIIYNSHKRLCEIHDKIKERYKYEKYNNCIVNSSLDSCPIYDYTINLLYQSLYALIERINENIMDDHITHDLYNINNINMPSYNDIFNKFFIHPNYIYDIDINISHVISSKAEIENILEGKHIDFNIYYYGNEYIKNNNIMHCRLKEDNINNINKHYSSSSGDDDDLSLFLEKNIIKPRYIYYSDEDNEVNKFSPYYCFDITYSTHSKRGIELKYNKQIFFNVLEVYNCFENYVDLLRMLDYSLFD